MRAIVFDGSKALLDERAQTPAAGPGEAVVRPVRMGVAGHEVALAAARHTPTPAAPITLGQEFVGVVEAVDESADRDLRKRWIGKRVVASPVIVCGRCDMCRAGLPAHCRNRRVIGITANGCFAASVVLPLRNLVELPASVGDDQGAFAQSLAGALHSAHLVRVEGKPYVTVLGDTVDGLLCAQVMARFNASVRLLGSNPGRFSLCEKWGIKHRHSSEVGRRSDQDIVVDCTGSTAGFNLALQLVRPRGKVVLRDHPHGGPANTPNLAAVVEHEIEVLGARNGSVADAVATLARGEIDVLSLITRRARLVDAPSILNTPARDETLRVLLEP